MKCPRCGKRLNRHRNWSPNLGYQPGFVYTHVYGLGELLSGKICTYTVTKSE